jgi:hypothetical protein
VLAAASDLGEQSKALQHVVGDFLDSVRAA